MSKSKNNTCKSCPPKPALKDRPLLTSSQVNGLVGLFKVLANDTRLRLLHAIAIHEEICVTDLAEALGMKPQAVSNQLQRLLDTSVVASRRDGNNMYYRVDDPCVLNVLDKGLCLLEDSLERSAQPV
jgi:ArsR family transcriptional regulator, lead/cadmium/zinc/bismuth-responsive transcriptional repressor